MFGQQILVHQRPPGSKRVTLVGDDTFCRKIWIKNLGICTMFLQKTVNAGLESILTHHCEVSGFVLDSQMFWYFKCFFLPFSALNLSPQAI